MKGGVDYQRPPIPALAFYRGSDPSGQGGRRPINGLGRNDWSHWAGAAVVGQGGPRAYTQAGGAGVWGWEDLGQDEQILEDLEV